MSASKNKPDGKMNLLERIVASYVESRNGREEERLCALPRDAIVALLRVERRAIIWSSVAGIVAGAVLGVVEIVFMQGLLEDMRGMTLLEQAPHWAWFLGFILLMSGLEVLFLYWNGLRAAASASRIAGLALATKTPRSGLLARALGRAAIDLPNPLEAIHGIDPYARVPRWRIWAWRFMYRLKVGVTSFVLRVFLRRVIGRTVFRVLIPLLAGPLYAIWNGIITWRIMREVRIRAFGPFAVRDLRRRIEKKQALMKKENRLLITAVVGEVVMLSEDAHPSFELLIRGLVDTLDLEPGDIKVDWCSQRERLGELGLAEKTLLLDAATLACLLDGRISRSEEELLADAHALCGLPFEKESLEESLGKLLNGQSPFSRSLEEGVDQLAAGR